MLGVQDEALVQYDELDALFTQFVLNSNVSESPGKKKGFLAKSLLIYMKQRKPQHLLQLELTIPLFAHVRKIAAVCIFSSFDMPDWLRSFSSSPPSDWSGLSLEPAVAASLRALIQRRRPSLLDLRNYLFGRQCALLLKVHKPWEVKHFFCGKPNDLFIPRLQ